MLIFAVLLTNVAVAQTASVQAPALTSSLYGCWTHQRAAISDPAEPSEPPQAGKKNQTWDFVIEVTRDRKSFRRFHLREVIYDGTVRPKTTVSKGDFLQSSYEGNGRIFYARNGPALMSFEEREAGIGILLQATFYHAGYERVAGGHKQVAVRSGFCSVITRD